MPRKGPPPTVIAPPLIRAGPVATVRAVASLSNRRLPVGLRRGDPLRLTLVAVAARSPARIRTKGLPRGASSFGQEAHPPDGEAHGHEPESGEPDQDLRPEGRGRPGQGRPRPGA